MELLGGEVRDADGYIFVRNASVPDERRARTILASVDEALRKSGHRAVLFDTRQMEAPSEAVNAILRWWVDAGRLHDKVALLVKSDLKRIASNMRALSVGVQMRSFHDLNEAETWLRRPLKKPRTSPSPAAVAASTSPAPSPFKGTLNSRGRETGTVVSNDARNDSGPSARNDSGPIARNDSGPIARKDAGRDARNDTDATIDPGPASRWRSSLLRGVVGSGDES